MSTENRRRNVIGFEGQTMAFAGQYGLDVGREHAQCVIDGAANALAQMHGPEETAIFLYAVADRIVANIRQPTPLPAALLPAPRAAQLLEHVDVPPAVARRMIIAQPTARRRAVRRGAIAIAWVFVLGLWLGLALAMGLR
jgi:hypothetical protein